MSTCTPTYPPPRRITPDAQPVTPCWVWDTHPATRGWKRFEYKCGDFPFHSDYTHWIPLPAQPVPAPLESPDAACEREVARLKGQLEAAEQHVKILTEQRDSAQTMLKFARWRGDAPEPAAPKVQKVYPWTAADVPLGCWVRSKSQRNHVALITQIAPEAVIIPSGIRSDPKNPECIIGDQQGTTVSYAALAQFHEHSTDGGKTWLPAGRVVTEETA